MKWWMIEDGIFNILIWQNKSWQSLERVKNNNIFAVYKTITVENKYWQSEGEKKKQGFLVPAGPEACNAISGACNARHFWKLLFNT